jgi:CBS domain-containing protein
MGSEKVTIANTDSLRAETMRTMLMDLRAMEQMLEMDLFEKGQQHLGAEQELCFVDKQWKPASIIMDILPLIDDPHFTTELSQFNMEINLDPIPFRGDCFSELERQLTNYLELAEEKAQELEAHILLTGILPTIRRGDVDLKNLTPLKRYAYLLDYLAEMRKGLFEFRIEGTDTLITKDTHAMFEGCNTSFQVHYQLPPEEFVAAYNWSQAITGPVLSAMTNSPLLLGNRLWRETRIALFQQATDTRNPSQLSRGKIPRVAFGSHWIHDSVMDLHKDNIARYPIMLSPTRPEDSLALLAEGKVPQLQALNIHNGSIWRWNRPCYGVANGVPHLRIESRVIPAGPTILDEVANAALWMGLMKGMPDQYANLKDYMDFDCAKDNFLRAAKVGIDAHFAWPGWERKISAGELLIGEMIPIAREGLQKAGINADDINRYLGIVEERVWAARTGSTWILETFNSVKKHSSVDEALVTLTAGMYSRQQKGEPGHTWDLPEIQEAGEWQNRYGRIEQIMTTDLFTANEDDIVEFVAHIMHWRNVRHVPVENASGELVGLVTSKVIINYFSSMISHEKTEPCCIRELMETKLITVDPETSSIKAASLLEEHGISCLPVVRNNELLGIVTERDFVKVAGKLLKEVLPE